MHRKIGLIIGFTVLIGVLALAFNTAFGNQTVTYLSKVRFDYGTFHFYMWKFNFTNYVKGLELSTSDLSRLQFNLPARQWRWTGDMEDWFPDLANNLAVILDYLIVIANAILYPLRVGAYLLRNILALLGVNSNANDTNNGLGWLITFVNGIMEYAQIPFI